MLKRILITAAAVTLLMATGYADQTKGKLIIPVDKTSPTNGREMFNGYCAPCHGADARGHGPVATELKTPPTDLTVLARSNRGKYPDAHILAILEFGMEMRAHGNAEMPVWGPILGKMNHVNPQDKELRISNLNRYLETLQVK